jgi:ribose transport system substrate-binding protein
LRKFAFILGAIVYFGACDSKPAAPAGETSPPTIAVIPKGSTHEFWKSVHAGAAKAAREIGVRIEWRGPLKEDDREEQIQVVESFVTRGVSGIVLAPLDDKALAPAVESAVRAGIPVVVIDSDLQGEAHSSFVATDNVRGGRLAGDHMAKLLDGRGRVAMLRYQEGSASTTNRERGFLEALGPFPGIEVASANQYAGPTTETAFEASENLLHAHRGSEGLRLDGIFCPNESSAFGMLRALQDGGHAGKVKFIGFDTSPKLVEALERGEMHATVVQDPIRMGYLGVRTMADVLRGERVEEIQDTGATLVTPENMRDEAIRALLHPDFERWLK